MFVSRSSNFRKSGKTILAAFLLCGSHAHAGPIHATSTLSGTLNLTSGTDYFGWSGKSIAISSAVSSVTPTSVLSLNNGSVQTVYSAVVDVTGFEPNEAGTVTLTSTPTAGGFDSISVAMTYAKFGLTTTVTETLNGINPLDMTSATLLNTALSSRPDQIQVTSNWGENATFGIDGNIAPLTGIPNVATAPEPSSAFLLLAGLALISLRFHATTRKRV